MGIKQFSLLQLLVAGKKITPSVGSLNRSAQTACKYAAFHQVGLGAKQLHICVPHCKHGCAQIALGTVILAANGKLLILPPPIEIGSLPIM